MSRPSLTVIAFTAWVGVAAVVCVKPLFKPVSGTVFVTYATAGHEFLAGEKLYDVPHPHTDNFRYSPLVAAGFAPLSVLPLGVGGALWRLVSIAVFVTGLVAWARRVCPEVPLAGLFLLALPISLGSLSNGQANTLILGMMLWATVLAGRDRWALAALLVGAATLFKAYPLALAGLFTLIAPVRFGLPLLGTIAAGLVLPYAFQSAEYVSAQYQFWFENVARDDRTTRPLYSGYQDFHMLLRVVGIEIARSPYRLAQAGAGLAAAAVIVWLRGTGADRRSVETAAFTLGICWMVMFAPAVETSTFILLAPVMARELLDPVGRPRWAKVCALAGSGMFLIAMVALAFPHHIHRPVIATGVQPLGALLVSVAALGRIFAVRPAVPELRPAVQDTGRARAA